MICKGPIVPTSKIWMCLTTSGGASFAEKRSSFAWWKMLFRSVKRNAMPRIILWAVSPVRNSLLGWSVKHISRNSSAWVKSWVSSTYVWKNATHLCHYDSHHRNPHHFFLHGFILKWLTVAFVHSSHDLDMHYQQKNLKGIDPPPPHTHTHLLIWKTQTKNKKPRLWRIILVLDIYTQSAAEVISRLYLSNTVRVKIIAYNMHHFAQCVLKLRRETWTWNNRKGQIGKAELSALQEACKPTF